jgi:hypothetical protein
VDFAAVSELTVLLHCACFLLLRVAIHSSLNMQRHSSACGLV